MSAAHEMQHPDSPTWCIHCGTFDIYCDGSECTENQIGQYNAAVHAREMFTGLFGLSDLRSTGAEGE